ncbi:hypothetical protein MNEG_14131 [Monoraphidium neglectum]|uniref:N-acetyltransferase domain-containing protein n=1 Tax=Monoraphidium neglectum TaxID=145388 RepID=A0A0D2MFE9_9CHLO|nr:hypothetical protein MNEG_14131 [Monoraphidium neglectum]KIY93830.1 hypothetical protein MNEG_14131 [Monoraphidium neglectum]|eukprot:XP_013892850.1 hypothetical protein MNEG_14131 [Monoraphidium neglectum]
MPAAGAAAAPAAAAVAVTAARWGARARSTPRRAPRPVASAAPVAPLETAAATAAAPLTAAAESRGDLAAAAAADEGSNLLQVTVRPVSGLLELRQVARLRAEAYYADDRSRFAESFKRQFASQEVDSLQHRTAPRGPGRAPQCDCLVAVDGAGLVAGCIDVRVPQAETGLPASGVPAGEPRGAYILNVVVAEHQRGRGVGRQLMRAAMARAVRVWGATRLFTHVEAGNDVASGLYRGCGFSEHSGSGALEGATTLGRLLLLVAEGDAVDTSVPSGDDPAPAPAA